MAKAKKEDSNKGVFDELLAPAPDLEQFYGRVPADIIGKVRQICEQEKLSFNKGYEAAFKLFIQFYENKRKK